MGTKQIVEAILFAAEKPMTVKQLQKIYPEIERPELTVIQNAIDSIIEDYAARPIALKHLSSGYRFQVKERYSYWVSRIFEDKPPKYSRALLETVAIVAYRQPVTRGDIEDIRGVSVSSNIIRTLLDREWIRVIAYKEVPGRPALYGSTKQFLDYFNLSSLDQLPTLEEIKECDFGAKDLESNNNELTHPQNENAQDAKLEAIAEKEQRVEEKSKQKSEKKECEEQEIIEQVLENRQ
ncbi:MAG: SMC-Scp complex subunit ScpB [Methylococcales symbiont of Iophon sp. n. MRB-2018]|nr:MAG: SMC-Scp complex subunit ScpB [Methylococcales symbiont of Iophon sp. n. MRB-2018]KAF3979654.1 MAG: SMC-Scp complex subunit ScpB [Methylococcales symbiont of Iophon sp. n. MRB-2018]